MKIGAAYIRVSDDRQDEYSPDSQLKRIYEHAKKNNYIIPDNLVFYDDGISAKSVKHRTEFNNMIALSKEKDCPFEAIFVWKFSRFARNQEESIVYKSLLNKRKIEVISVSEPIIEGPFGSLIERIIEWMDEYYLINLSSEVRRGMLEKASRGEAMTRGVLGYTLSGKTYIKNENAPIVENIFQSYLNGEGMRAIALRLANEGLVTSFGNPPDNRWVSYTLQNPVYIGKIRWSKEGRSASRRKYDSENLLVIDAAHEPIISKDVWDAVQNKIKTEKTLYPKYQRKEQPVQFMLKGLVRCDCCGATLVRQSTVPPSMQCHNYAKGLCHISHSISINKANGIVIRALEETVRTGNIHIEQQEKPKTETSNYFKLIAQEEKKLERIREAYEKGIDTIEEYRQNKARINDNIKKIKELLNQEQEANYEIDKAAYTQKIADILKLIKDSSTEEAVKNQALRSVVSNIVFNKKENSLDIHYHS